MLTACNAESANIERESDYTWNYGVSWSDDIQCVRLSVWWSDDIQYVRLSVWWSDDIQYTVQTANDTVQTPDEL